MKTDGAIEGLAISIHKIGQIDHIPKQEKRGEENSKISSESSSLLLVLARF